MAELTTETVYTIAVPIILLMIVAESIYSSFTNKRYYKAADTWGTIGMLLGNMLMGVATKAAVFTFSLYLFQFRLFDITNALPLWAVWLLTFFAIDFVFYWYHRISHRVRFMWAVHMNHHCSEEMNFSVSFRQAWFGPISKIPFFAVLPLVGFDPTITVVAGVISTLWGVVGHTQWVVKLGALEWFFNTPSHHRVHHGSNPQYIDKNYGNLFIIWDRMFGTFAEEKEAVVFGLVKNVNTQNPIKLTFMVWIDMFLDIKQAKNISEAVRYFAGPPHKDTSV